MRSASARNVSRSGSNEVKSFIVPTEFRILFYRNAVNPPPATPADLHDSVEELETTLQKWGLDGWQFPGAWLEEVRGNLGSPSGRYRLRAGGIESPAMMAVRTEP